MFNNVAFFAAVKRQLSGAPPPQHDPGPASGRANQGPLPVAAHTSTVMGFNALSQHAITPLVSSDSSASEPQAASALIHALHAALNDCFWPGRELQSPADVKALQLRLLRRLVDIHRARLYGAIARNNAMDCKARIGDLVQWHVARAVCAAVQRNPTRDDGATAASPVDVLGCVAELSITLKCGALSALGFVADKALFGDVALLTMLLTRPEDTAGGTGAANLRVLLLEPLLRATQQIDPVAASPLPHRSGSVADIVECHAVHMESPVADAELPGNAADELADTRAFLAGRIAVVGARALLRELTSPPCNMGDGNEDEVDSEQQQQQQQQQAEREADVQMLQELWAQLSSTDSAQRQHEGKHGGSARTTAASASPLESRRRSALESLAMRTYAAVMVREARRLMDTDRPHEACAAAALALEAANAVDGEADCSAMFNALQALVHALLDSGNNSDALERAHEGLAVAERVWRTQPRTFRRGVALLRALELVVHAEYRCMNWSGALQRVSEAAAHAARVQRLAELDGETRVIEDLRLRIQDACWRLSLHMNRRVLAATRFYEYLGLLQERTNAPARSGAAAGAERPGGGGGECGGGDAAADAAIAMCDAYAARAEMLLAMAARAKVAAGSEEEEAISMLKGAIETSARFHWVPKLARSRIELQCRIAQPYMALAAKEGNKRAMRQMVHEAVTFAYDALRRSTTLADRAQCTLVVARGMLQLQQYRKGALLLEEVLDETTRHADAAGGLRGDQELHLRAVLGQCRAAVDPEAAMATLTPIVQTLEQLTAATPSPSGNGGGFSRKAQQRHKDLTRLLADVSIALGDSAMAIGSDHERALGFYSRALNLYTDAQLGRDEASTFGRLARVHRALRQQQTALAHLQHMLTLGTDLADHKITYEAVSMMADTLAAMGRHKDAGSLWSQLVSTARRFDDGKVERAALYSLIRSTQEQQTWKEVVKHAKALEKLCAEASREEEVADDAVFALQAMAEAYLHLGAFQKCVEIVDRVESVEGVSSTSSCNGGSAKDSSGGGGSVEERLGVAIGDDATFEAIAAPLKRHGAGHKAGSLAILRNASLTMHSQGQQPQADYQRHSQATPRLQSRADLTLLHSLRARALLALRQDDAALDVLQEWGSRAEAAGNAAEAARAHLALAGALARVSPLEARDAFFAVVDACRRAPDDDFLEAHQLATPGGTAAAAAGSSAAGSARAERCAMVFAAVAWLLHEFYLVEEPIEVVDSGGSKGGGGSSDATADAVVTASGDGPADAVVSLVYTLNFRVALEVLEVALRFALQHRPWRQVSRSPRTALDVALAARGITWVFFSLIPDARATAGDAVAAAAPGHSAPPAGSGAGERRAAGRRLRFGVVVRPSGMPVLCNVEVSVKSSAIAAYHSAQRAMGTDDLYLSLRSLNDALWAPVATLLTNATRSSGASTSTRECVAVVPDPAIAHVPFAALVSVHRKTVGQRCPVVIVPCLDAFAAAGAVAESCPRATPSVRQGELAPNRTALLPERRVMRQSIPSAHPEETEVRSSVCRRSSVAFHELCDAGWTVAEGCTRKELWAAMRGDASDALAVLLDVSEANDLRTADGCIRSAELAAFVDAPATRRALALTSSRCFRPTTSDMGPAAMIAARGGLRVLRVDLPPDASVTAQHEHFVANFFSLVDCARKNGIAFPYAAAFHAAHCDAIRAQAPPHVWSSFALVGAP